MYDIIIIGAGISGLYAAYKILKLSPDSKILILEAESHVGGRAGNLPFQGINVVNGAGIGRKQKDKLLISLLKELGIKYGEFEVTPRYAPTISEPCYLKRTFLDLRKKYNPDKHRSLIFQEYATSILGKEAYNHFVICSGYTDYEKEDAHGVLYHYGFDDNYDKWTGLGISWKDMTKSLEMKIGKKNIKCSHRVSKIIYDDNIYQIKCENGSNFESGKLIMATTVDSVKKLLPGPKTLYRNIHAQPFLRIYGKFSKASTAIMQQFCPQTTVVPGPLHKIIPMNTEKGIYMIAYTDNKDAKTLNKYAENTESNRKILCKLLEKAFGMTHDQLSLLAIRYFYWTDGTHYCTPLPEEYKNRKEFLKKAQHPFETALVVGEMISLNQGWVEGALESVEHVVSEKWIHGK